MGGGAPRMKSRAACMDVFALAADGHIRERLIAF